MKGKHYHEVDRTGKAKYTVALLEPEEFTRFWPNIEEMLDTVPHTWRHWTKEYIFNAALSTHMQVWCVGPNHTCTCVYFTQVSILPAMRVFCIVWAGGAFDDETIPLLETAWDGYAQANDCSEIAVYGRLGWEAKLKPLGFRRESSVWVRRVVSKKVH